MQASALRKTRYFDFELKRPHVHLNSEPNENYKRERRKTF